MRIPKKDSDRHGDLLSPIRKPISDGCFSMRNFRLGSNPGEREPVRKL
jgi:hypothetical protein